MIKPPVPRDEKNRLKELESYSILDTLPEQDFDNITTIASQICGTNISLISLIDNDRQWFKSRKGLDAEETPREYAFCAHAINDPSNVLIVNDSRLDERFMGNPLVDDDPHVIFYAGVPLITSSGQALGTLCVIDNSPKQLSEDQVKALKALSNHTMNLLEQRKMKEELKIIVDKLAQRNEELEQFATVSAHDLKSPLNNISIISRGILNSQGQLNAEIENSVELIYNSSKTLKNLIDGLLEHSRSDKVLSESKVCVSIHSLKKKMNELFSDSEINWQTDLNEIHVNETALEKILINLISNAVKYNDKDTPVIMIDISKNEKYYQFSVTDNGPGINPEDSEKIFELYEVTHNKDKYGQAGTGIGLATVRKMVRSLGGKIQLDLDFTNGAKFIFNIEH